MALQLGLSPIERRGFQFGFPTLNSMVGGFSPTSAGVASLLGGLTAIPAPPFGGGNIQLPGPYLPPGGIGQVPDSTPPGLSDVNQAMMEAILKMLQPDFTGLETAAQTRTAEALRQVSGMAGGQGLLGSSLQTSAAADIASKIQAETAAEAARQRTAALTGALGAGTNLMNTLFGYDLGIQRLILDRILGAGQMGAGPPGYNPDANKPPSPPNWTDAPWWAYLPIGGAIWSGMTGNRYGGG